jgi:hypothetical protein
MKEDSDLSKEKTGSDTDLVVKPVECAKKGLYPVSNVCSVLPGSHPICGLQQTIN